MVSATSWFQQVTEQAALAVVPWIGKGDRTNADKAAVMAMRKTLHSAPFSSRVVVGEGEYDQAPHLDQHELFGPTDSKQFFDLAVDPLEGTTPCSQAQPEAMTVLAAGAQGIFLPVPDILMDKIACGIQGVVHLDATPTENVKALAKIKGVPPDALTVAVLDRERNNHIIEALRSLGTQVALISDNDISPAICCALKTKTIDLLMGSGGAPEGVLAAAALKCLGGDFQARLLPANDTERKKCSVVGIVEPDRVYQLQDIIRGDVIFSATGVTGGRLLSEVQVNQTHCRTHSLVIGTDHHQPRWVHTEHPASN